MRARLLTASMSGLVGGLKKPQILASPRTVDPLFRRIEEVHDEAAQPFGHILDAGTGGHSLKWLGTLPKDAVASVTAVTADASAGEGKGASDARAALDPARGDALVEGKWCVPGAAPPLTVARFDTVLCDYLVGSMDGFTPFLQDAFFDELRPLCAADALVHVVGLNPVYATTAPPPTDAAQQIVVDTARLRDACILLAAHRPYREFPPSWVIRHLERSGFEVVDPWKSYGVVWNRAGKESEIPNFKGSYLGRFPLVESLFSCAGVEACHRQEAARRRAAQAAPLRRRSRRRRGPRADRRARRQGQGGPRRQGRHLRLRLRHLRAS